MTLLAQIPNGDQLLALSEQGTGVILALAALMLLVVLAAFIVYLDRTNRRATEAAAARAANEAKEEETNTTQLIELARTVSTVVKANLDTAAAIRQLANEVREGNALSRQFLERADAKEKEQEGVAREIAAEAVTTVMTKLADIEMQLKRPSITRQLEELLRELDSIKKSLVRPTETPP